MQIPGSQEAAPANPYGSLRNPSFLTIPETGVLRHTQARFSGDMLYFNTSEIQVGGASTDTVEEKTLNYGSDLAFGFENRGEISLQLSSGVSVGIKALLLDEDVYVPDLVFGIRNLFFSQEAAIYGVTDRTIARGLRGESYVGAAKHLTSKMRLHLGASLLYGANKSPAGFYGGAAYDLGAGAVATYEVFERFSDFHQTLGLSWHLGNIFSLTVAMTELQSWIRQDGEWGFYLAPTRPQSTGYNSPGIRASLSVSAFVPKTDRRTLTERVADLEKREKEKIRETEELKGRITTLRMEQEAARRAVYQLSNSKKTESLLEGPAADLRLLVELFRSDNFEPGALRVQVGKILAHGDKARPVLIQASTDTSAAEDGRVAALIAIAASQDSSYVPSLSNLCRDRHPRIRREAVTALSKIQPKAAEAAARPMLKDPDETVALTARTALKEMGFEEKGK